MRSLFFPLFAVATINMLSMCTAAVRVESRFIAAKQSTLSAKLISSKLPTLTSMMSGTAFSSMASTPPLHSHSKNSLPNQSMPPQEPGSLIRHFSSSSALFSSNQRPSRWQIFTRKYEPEIDHVMRRIDHFTRYQFIGGVTNGQILLFVFVMNLFFPIQNYVNFFFLIVMMVINMMS